VGIVGERPGAGGSTMGVNIAAGLAAEGLRVGLAGTDARSPLLPMMLGAEQPDPQAGALRPAERFGVRVACLAWLLTGEERMRRRPPTAAELALRFTARMDWGRLNILLVDLALDDDAEGLAGFFDLDGMVLVATPRGATEGATEAAVAALRELGRPILGVIENMSYYHCSQCGREEDAEASGAVESVTARLGAHSLGAAPISIGLRDAMAAGRPGMGSDWDPSDAEAFRRVTLNIWKRVLATESRNREPLRAL
jgi:ATP-binding protein involved in chromosome partitioning